jgi:hypothetical protein
LQLRGFVIVVTNYGTKFWITCAIRDATGGIGLFFSANAVARVAGDQSEFHNSTFGALREKINPQGRVLEHSCQEGRFPAKATASFPLAKDNNMPGSNTFGDESCCSTEK